MTHTTYCTRDDTCEQIQEETFEDIYQEDCGPPGWTKDVHCKGITVSVDWLGTMRYGDCFFDCMEMDRS